MGRDAGGIVRAPKARLVLVPLDAWGSGAPGSLVQGPGKPVKSLGPEKGLSESRDARRVQSQGGDGGMGVVAGGTESWWLQKGKEI